MLRKLLLGSLILIGVTTAMVSCVRSEKISSAESMDGDHPLVFRSVLDRKARMVTIALQDSLWMAYDGNSGALYKIWRDGVLFDGPVYTTAHGPQPESIGDAYLVSPYSDPWMVVSHGDTLDPQVQYLGHRFEEEEVTLTYRLGLASGQNIYIKEKPVATQKEESWQLTREFLVDGLQEDQVIHLASNAASLQAWPATKNVSFIRHSFSDEPVPGAYHSYTIDGMLVFGQNGPASLTYWFHDDPLIRAKVVEENLGIHPGLALIERSDCKSCHNEEVKTIGPAYFTIAEKYPFTESQVSSLANKVIKGGSGVWGEQVMTAHPDLMEADAKLMIGYILSLDGEEAPAPVEESPLDDIVMQTDAENAGILLNVYTYDEPLTGMPGFGENDVPVFSGPIPVVYAMTDEAFQGLDQHFAFELEGFIDIPEDNTYLFAISSDDGSFLYLDDELVIDNDGFHAVETKEAEVWLTKGLHPIRMTYFQAGGGKGVSLEWRMPGDNDLKLIGPKYLRHDPEKIQQAGPPISRSDLVRSIPGDQYPLQEVHPAFTLENIRPESFEPKVGGMDFLDEDNLLVSTWDPRGSVWKLGNIKEGNPETVTVTRIASGLAEPLGLKVVDGDIFVLQKQELTQLIDHDDDGFIDEYRTVSNAWRVSANFHEFAFGLAYQDGWFYAALATAIEPGGASTNPQIPDRGKAIRINRETGKMEFVAHGLRTPNGVGEGVDGELFIADNQGDWLPASKIVHVKEGAFYGSRSVDFEGTANIEVTQPVVWLPQDEIGNSPSQPIYIDKGPYAGQMLHGEVTHGGIKRVFVEEVDREYQGAVFRFSQGLEAGVNRMTWGPDDKLYIGGVGNPGNWSHYGKYWYGLQRLAYNGNSVFEMLAVRAGSDGIEIEFTEPLPANMAMDPATWEIRQWRYIPTENYGGPKIDEQELPISSISLSEDQKTVFLSLSGMREGHLIYVHLDRTFASTLGHSLWTTEAWYTLNKIPTESRDFTSAFPFVPIRPNTLSEDERTEGWELLFDGQSTNGWHTYGGEGIGSAWRVENGMLTLNGEMDGWQFKNSGDIVTDDVFEDFELELEWQIEEGGNSGLMYFVQEEEGLEYPWLTGCEMQILDNERHPDGKIEKHRAGDLYDLIETSFVTVKPAGEWNRVKLVVQDGKVEHWLNGYLVVSYDATSEEHAALIQGSKFAEMEGFGQYRPGRISLQDHGNRVWFRNVKIRAIERPAG